MKFHLFSWSKRANFQKFTPFWRCICCIIVKSSIYIFKALVIIKKFTVWDTCLSGCHCERRTSLWCKQRAEQNRIQENCWVIMKSSIYGGSAIAQPKIEVIQENCFVIMKSSIYGSPCYSTVKNRKSVPFQPGLFVSLLLR